MLDIQKIKPIGGYGEMFAYGNQESLRYLYWGVEYERNKNDKICIHIRFTATQWEKW